MTGIINRPLLLRFLVAAWLEPSSSEGSESRQTLDDMGVESQEVCHSGDLSKLQSSVWWHIPTLPRFGGRVTGLPVGRNYPQVSTSLYSRPWAVSLKNLRIYISRAWISLTSATMLQNIFFKQIRTWPRLIYGSKIESSWTLHYLRVLDSRVNGEITWYPITTDRSVKLGAAKGGESQKAGNLFQRDRTEGDLSA